MKKLEILQNLQVLSFGSVKRLLSLKGSGRTDLDTDKENFVLVDDTPVPKFSCNKCKMRAPKYPVFTPEILEIKGKKRKKESDRVIVFLVGAPVSDEAIVTDEARKLITSWCNKYITAERIYITPVVKCPHSKDPTKNSVQCCEQFLKHELLTLKPDVVVCLGKAAAIPFGLDGKAKELQNRVYDLKPLKYVKTHEDGTVEEIITRKAKLLITESPAKFTDDIKVRSTVEATFRQAERFSKNPDIEPPGHYYLIESAEEFAAWAERHMSDPRLKDRVHAFDIETNGRAMHPKKKWELKYPPKLRCVSFSWAPGMAICVPYEEDPEGYHPILEKLMKSGIPWTGHNVAFDIFFLKLVCGIETTHLVGDTMLMASMINPGKGKYGYGLKPLAAEYTDLGGYETDMKSTPDDYGDVEEDGATLSVIVRTKWEKVAMDVMAPYNCADSDATLQIFHIFMKLFKERKMLVAHWIMTHALFPLGEMEHNGFLVSKEWVDKSRSEIEAICTRYEDELRELCDGREYDWGSPQALGMLMYQEFKYPVPNVDSNTFGKDDEDAGSAEMPTNDTALSIIDTPFTQTIRKWRRASKLLSTYFNGYFKNVGLDQRLRADFNLVGTITGRLSSSGDANLQNIPSGMASTEPGYDDLHGYKAKKAFVARPGWVIANADQSQLELRIAGACSGELGFITSYKNKIDMHSRNAKVSFNIQVDETDFIKEALALGYAKGSEDYNVYVERAVCKYIKKHYPEERQAAKSISFGILYGMSKWGLAQDLNNKGRDAGSDRIWTPEECAELIRKFKIGYPTLTKWQQGLIDFTRKYGYTYTVFGRRRYLPYINESDYSLRGKAERAAINTPVQSAGSDFMMSGVINMYQQLNPEKFRFAATVHDSIVCEVQEGYLDEWCKITKQCLEEPHINGQLVALCKIMPFIAEFEVGDSYGTMEGYEVG